MAQRVFCNEEKCDLPCQRGARESVEKSWMRDRRRIIAADHIKHEVKRGDDQHAPDGGDPKHNFRKSHCSLERCESKKFYSKSALGGQTTLVKVVRLVTAFECGAIVNPDGLRNQPEGGNIMALGGALFEAIEFANGQILNGRFSDYRVPRFSDVPVIETVMIDRKDIPSAGAGESSLMGVAPAIANAIFDASGVRLRSLPLVPDGLQIA